MTTSSLILKALVCEAMAAVLALSSQKNLRASGLVAIKPSASLALASCTTLDAASATASSLSEAISASSTIFGSSARGDLVE